MEDSKNVVVGLENIYGQLNNKELQENLSSFLPQLPGLNIMFGLNYVKSGHIFMGIFEIWVHYSTPC